MVKVIIFDVPNDYKVHLKMKCAEKDISLKDYIMKAIDEKMTRDD